MPTTRSLGALALSLLLPLLTHLSSHPQIPIPPSLTSHLHPAQIPRLQTYLNIRTDHPTPAYQSALTFLNATIHTLLPSAKTSIHTFPPAKEKPLLLATLPGSNPALPALLLNSHTDVVPANHASWSYPPFAARIILASAQSRIFARGAQDMKSVGLQYLEALSALYNTSWQPTRTIHISFVPDEEIGGRDGMGRFVASPLFRSLNVGVALDEGLPHPDHKFNVYYGERQPWWLVVSVVGTPAHGATFPRNTAAQTLHAIIGRALEFRKDQLQRFNKSGSALGDVLGINLVYFHAGSQTENGYLMNILPGKAEAGFDIRVPPGMDHAEMERIIDGWLICEDGKRCKGVLTRFIIQVKNRVVTSRDARENPFYPAFERGLRDAGIADKIVHGIFPASTDSRYLREVGVPCFGFSPIEQTPDLLHKHDEYISVDGYLKGITIYENIIRQLAGPLEEAKDAEQKEADYVESVKAEL